MSNKFSQKSLEHAKQSATEALKTFRKNIQKTIEATGDLIDNKIVNKIRKPPKDSQENNSETVVSDHDKEIPK